MPERSAMRIEQKQFFDGCGIANPGDAAFYQYPQDHPCRHCPYQFPVEVPNCSIGASPPNCVWHFYQELNRRKKL